MLERSGVAMRTWTATYKVGTRCGISSNTSCGPRSTDTRWGGRGASDMGVVARNSAEPRDGDPRRFSQSQPYTSADFDTAAAVGFTGGSVHEGKEFAPLK